MRMISASLSVSVGLLLLGWAGPSAASFQDCCHPSAVKTTSSQTNHVAGVKPMPARTTDEVREEFNASSDKVRIVALLSPTCTGCRSGHGVVGQVLKKFSSPNLQAILVWEPMRDGDSPVAATQQAATVRDARIWQGWNENRNIGKLFGDTLNLHDIAWDVYLVYRPGITWAEQQPPPPTFWMHQLAGVDPNLLLCENPGRLGAEVGKLLEQPSGVPHGN
jgi:hypothetical protein